MTIAELIQQLQKFDQTAVVAILPYGRREVDFLEVAEIEAVHVTPDHSEFGLHLADPDFDVEAARCVVLS